MADSLTAQRHYLNVGIRLIVVEEHLPAVIVLFRVTGAAVFIVSLMAVRKLMASFKPS